ncbi:hypothetical protein CDD80_6972 [Ophiocordyceps camponoti-rufipedis]|uniref:Uncharacterized protein n=1 Tax=Ophiocordyceps camponoti-rufipedis TaxID=2004952 RepID=A0A2C5YQG7_9HYPO|nr:hypothetical protein CDD80_6972 [Ophiocordyceps camponoti-rufipedis]
MKPTPILLLAALPTALPQKLPWLEPPSNPTSCIPLRSSEKDCGTRLFCNHHDFEPGPREYPNAQACFDAHHPAPLLPWIPAPEVDRNDDSCWEHDEDSCPRFCEEGGKYREEQQCGTEVWCSYFDENRWWPFLFESKQACLDAHASNSTEAPAAMNSTKAAHGANSIEPAGAWSDTGAEVEVD